VIFLASDFSSLVMAFVIVLLPVDSIMSLEPAIIVRHIRQALRRR
jgi:hypothetical protein